MQAEQSGTGRRAKFSKKIPFFAIDEKEMEDNEFMLLEK
jgi:hypothetical protein